MVSDLLTSSGFYEMKSNSLTRASYHDLNGEEDPEAVRIFNPLSQDLAHMRKNLLNGGLEAIAYNINRKSPDLKLYEFGYCYYHRTEAAGKELSDRFEDFTAPSKKKAMEVFLDRLRDYLKRVAK